MHLAIAGVGPQRTGSTWLYECLRGRPELCFPSGVKETLFFDERFHEGWPWYWSHFRHYRPGQRCAEIGATYFHQPEVAQRLRAHSPACRIIVTLRDPADRTFSLYLHERKKGRIRGDFAAALQQHPQLLEASRYRLHLARWRETFGPDRVLVVLLDDVAIRPLAELERVYDFLGLHGGAPPAVATRRINVASLPAHRSLARLATVGADRLRSRRLYGPIELAKKLGLKRLYTGARGHMPALDGQVRQALVAELDGDIEYVEEMLERPLPQWRRAG